MTFKLLAWLCLATAAPCPFYDAPNHKLFVMKEPDRATCEAAFKEMDSQSPDPDGYKSNHSCTPISEDM